MECIATYGQDVEKHATHIIAVPLTVVVHMAVIMEIRCVSRRVVHLEVLAVSEFVTWRDRRERYRALGLQSCMRRVGMEMGRRLYLDFERLVAGVGGGGDGCMGVMGMIVGIFWRMRVRVTVFMRGVGMGVTIRRDMGDIM